MLGPKAPVASYYRVPVCECIHTYIHGCIPDCASAESVASDSVGDVPIAQHLSGRSRLLCVQPQAMTFFAAVIIVFIMLLDIMRACQGAHALARGQTQSAL